MMGQVFVWTEDVDRPFEGLKKVFTSALLVHPVTFHSRKFDAAEINYEIHDKELLAILDTFVQWRHFLEGPRHQVRAFNDLINLAYFQNARVLNR